MYLLQKFTKTCLVITILVSGIFTVDRNTFNGDPVAEGIIKVAKKVDPRQLLCMTENIYREAGGESILGKAAVAHVVMNRVSHGFGKNPCDVVNQVITVINNETNELKKVCQFSWRCETDLNQINRSSVSYKQSERVAYEVLAYDSFNDVVPKSTLFFHNTSVSPNWPYHKVAKIDNHVFYSKSKPKSKPNEQSRKRP